MGVKASAWAWEQDLNSQVELLVLLALADYTNDDAGFTCYPSQSALARRCRCSVSTVYRALGALEAAGFITREKRGAEGGGRSSDLYVLNVKVIVGNSRKTPTKQSNHSDVKEGVTGQRDGKELNVTAMTGLKRHSYDGGTTTEPPLEKKNPPLVPLPEKKENPKRIDYDQRVQIRDDGKLVVADEYRNEWLSQFGNDPEAFRLAVVEATPWVTRNSRHPEVQLSGQLARQLRERRERSLHAVKREEERRRDDPFYGRSNM